MVEYIEREAALMKIMQDGCSASNIAVLKSIPAADVAPVRHSMWAHIGGDEWCCTNCGFVISTEGSWENPEKKYCEECGTKMDLGGDDNG